MTKIVLVLGISMAAFAYGSLYPSGLPDTSAPVELADISRPREESTNMPTRQGENQGKTLVCMFPSASEKDMALVFSGKGKRCVIFPSNIEMFIFSAGISEAGLKWLQENVSELRGKTIKVFVTVTEMERQAELLQEIEVKAQSSGVTFVYELLKES